MILVDLNQVMISNLMQQINGYSGELSKDLIRHMVFNSLRSYKQKFSKDFGRIVICCDDKNYWRKQVFPFYKASRKKMREESDYDWNMIFETLNEIRDDIRENAPYLVLQIEHAEADDIIGTICAHIDAEQPLGAEEILILSGDKDFQQLQQYLNVTQFSPILKKYLKCSNPQSYLMEHILSGDRGDGIPNVLSEDNVFVDGIRQKPLSKKKLEEFSKNPPVDDDKFKRNKGLIDLTQVPDDIKTKIIDAFNANYIQGNKRKLLDLFIAKKMRNMIDVIEEF